MIGEPGIVASGGGPRGGLGGGGTGRRGPRCLGSTACSEVADGLEKGLYSVARCRSGRGALVGGRWGRAAWSVRHSERRIERGLLDEAGFGGGSGRWVGAGGKGADGEV